MMTLLTVVAMVDGGVTACIIIANSISATCMIMLKIWLHMMFSMFSVLSKSAMTARVACECGWDLRRKKVPDGAFAKKKILTLPIRSPTESSC